MYYYFLCNSLSPSPPTPKPGRFLLFLSTAFCSSAACFSHCQLSSIALSVLMTSHPGRVQRGSAAWLINFIHTQLFLCVKHWKSKDEFNIRPLVSVFFENQNIKEYISFLTKINLKILFVHVIPCPWKTLSFITL